jgi:hypothetical protein
MDSANYSEKINTLNSLEQLDEETEDEISYDEEAATKKMDEIYSKTKDNDLFMNIYKTAALRMFSEDPEIGLAVLFSYDYLPLFYLCLVEYFKSLGTLNNANTNYSNLLKKIS